MQVHSARKRWIDLTHTVHTLRGMKKQKSLLAAVFVSTLAFTSVACDDDPATPRDAGMDRTPDVAVSEGGVDRTPDTTTTSDATADKAPDTTTPDGGVDKAPDSMLDAPADVSAADMAAADKAPDTTVDLPPDTTPDLAPDATPDTVDAMASINGCTTYDDRTATTAIRQVTWNMTVATRPEHCMRVKLNQTVCWYTSSFATHPLAPSGGDSPSPITANSAATIVNCVNFNRVGTFGYKCTVHAEMVGAVQVVP
jgi:plastocyanin